MDIDFIEFPSVDFVKIQAGYYKGEHYYFDIFLAIPKERKAPPPAQYKRFTARLQKLAEINILLTKSQVQALGGLDLQNLSCPSPETDKRINERFRDVKAQKIECMLPVVNISERSNLFRIQQLLHGIQVIEDDDNENSEEEIVVGIEFITQMGFNIFVRGPSWMHTTTVEMQDLEPWDLETENLEMLEFGEKEISNQIGERQNYDLTKVKGLGLEEFEEEKVEMEAKIQEIKEWIQRETSIDQLKKLTIALLDFMSSIPLDGKETEVIQILNQFNNKNDT